MAQIDLTYDMDDLIRTDTVVNVNFEYTSGTDYRLEFSGSRIEVIKNGESLGFIHFSELEDLIRY